MHICMSVQYMYVNVPASCQRNVKDLYSNLTIFVQSFQWKTGLVDFERGVFQGNALSVAVFNMVINLYVDTTHISQPSFQVFVLVWKLQPSSDTICWWHIPCHQKSFSLPLCMTSAISLSIVLLMKVNVIKCCTLATDSQTKMQVFHLKIHIDARVIPFIGLSTFMFLGMMFDVYLTNPVVKNTLLHQLVSKHSWLMVLLDLPVTWIEIW